MDLGHLVLDLRNSDEYLQKLVTVQLAIVLVLEAVDARISRYKRLVKRRQREVATVQLGAVAILLEVRLTNTRVSLAVCGIVQEYVLQVQNLTGSRWQRIKGGRSLK